MQSARQVIPHFIILLLMCSLEELFTISIRWNMPGWKFAREKGVAVVCEIVCEVLSFVTKLRVAYSCPQLVPHED